MGNVRIGFIGWGSMAEAMIKGILRTGVAKPENIAATGTRKERGESLERQYGICVTSENTSILDCVDILVLAVKPQVAPCVLAELRGKIPASTLVVSIMAGISIRQIQEGLQTTRVIRCMPNTPSKVGMGYTGWTAADEVGSGEKEIVREMLASLGKEKYFAKEYLLHAVTAASATAVALVCEFIEALIGAAVFLGISWSDARGMVLQVIKGTVALMEESGQHPAVLRDEVTSPDGTTTRMRRSLEEGRFRFTILESMRTSCEKSVEMGKS